MVGSRAFAYDFSSKTEGQFPLDLYYAINADGSTVTLVQGPETYSSLEVIIPKEVTYNGKTYKVIAIGSNAFYNADIKDVIIPEGVINILSNAFAESQVSKVQFPSSLRTVGNGAFSLTRELQAAEFSEGLEILGESAFGGTDYWGRGCGITSVNLPSTLTSIGEYAFSGCQYLLNVKVPNGIKEIKEKTFSGCSRLQKVILPNTLEVIGNEAFSGCALDGELPLTISLPSTLKRIGNGAFAGSSLRGITFPSSLQSIGYQAFAYSQLTEVVLPDNITSVGDHAFCECPNLGSITFSSQLGSLPKSVCSGCPLLVKAYIPNGITSIGNEAFRDCERLNSITLPESIVELGDAAFQGSGIININFPSKLKLLPGLLFSECNNLTEITIPEKIEELGQQLFYDCKNLKVVNLPGSLKSIGGSVFSGCSSLKTITIYHYIESVGQHCFTFCPQLKEVHVNKNIPPQIVEYPYLVDADNTITLYVPRGTKATYESTDGWKDFSKIVEEDVDGSCFFQVKAIVADGNANVKINGEQYMYEGDEIEMGTDVQITIEPYEGYVLKTLLCNGEDVTETVVNNTFMIPSISQNYTFEVIMKDKPVIQGDMDGDGELDVNDVQMLINVILGKTGV